MSTMRHCEFTGDKDTPWDGKPNRLCEHAGFAYCTLHKQKLHDDINGWRVCCDECETPFEEKDDEHNERH